MKRTGKVAVVAAGYALSVAAGGIAGWAYDARVSALPYDTSGGMYAGGQALASLGAFFAAALVPTALMLWFLRGNAGFWRAVGVLAVAFAAAGLLAVLSPLVTRQARTNVGIVLFDLFGLAQLLGVPLWTGAFALFALLAPTRPARRLLLVATGLELVIAACAAIHWFVPRPPF